MRFYSITLTNSKTGKPVTPSSLGGMKITSLTPEGNFNPAALNIEFDLPFTGFNQPDANAFLRIWGLGLKDISHALDLTPNGDTQVLVAISGGMSKGLPLANPAQQGLLLSGAVLQAWGNWVDTNQTLDMVFTTNLGANQDPANFSFYWPKGTQLKDAIAQTLAIAAPRLKQIINISPRLVVNYDETGIYNTFDQFAKFINGLSRAIIGGTYQGVQIASRGDSVIVWDGTQQPATNAVKQIAFQDMIGQPTWIDTATISVKLVLRGDLAVQDVIKVPPSLATTSQQSNVRFRDQSTFTGNYQIQSIHHYGNFRQPDAASWNTTIQAVAQTTST